MQLKNILFPDGTILSIDPSGDSAVAMFRDYEDLTYKIHFTGVTDIEINDFLHYDVIRSNLTKTETGQRLVLLDDDLESLIRVDFRDASVDRVDDP
ncbi:MAG: hypothetical protein ACYTGG_01630 [Planctomycetota bacterium]